MANGNVIEINEAEFQAAIKDFDRMIHSMQEKEVRKIQRAKAKVYFVEEMKRNSHSVRLENMISVTTAKKNHVPPYAVRIGVVKNDKALFPKFSAQALASVIEYGTAERYRQLKAAGFVTGRQSTGSMPAAPFLRPAWDANVFAFMAAVEKAIQQRVFKAVGRAA